VPATEVEVPTYEYRCKDCGTALEVVQAFTDDPLTTCEACGGALRKIFGSVGISFKGSGFYKNDSRNGSSSKGSSGDGDSSSKSDTGSGKGDAKDAKSGSTDAGSSSTPSAPATPAPKSSSPAAATP
jgi:putative FmdB family regulatory protein